MTNSIFLNWASMAISIFNTILLLWLGATVILNAEHRNWGVYLATGGLLLGGAFFVSHSAILGLGVNQFTVRNMTFWWTVGLIPTTLLPFAWYIIILWFSGFWVTNPPLRKRHQLFFYIIILILMGGLISLFAGVLMIASPPGDFVLLRRTIRSTIFGVPILAIGYSIYVLACFGLSVDALRQPAPSNRIMGSRARQRAHPWLVRAAVALLVVSLLVTGVMLWIVEDTFRRSFVDIYAESQELIITIDLIISSVIAVAIFMLGQAVVSYEVFTGKTLPRGGLFKHWQRVVILAMSYGFVIGAVRGLRFRNIYGLLLATILMTFFFALVSWRSYVERDRFMDNLRPFILSQHLYEQLLTSSTPQEVNIAGPFKVLCDEVLEAKMAYLAALGPMSALTGPPIAFPDSLVPKLPPLNNLMNQFTSPNVFPVPVSEQTYSGATWAISLWSERGLIGVLLLGEKRAGGVYTQEEMEIARAVGERLIDTQASGIMSQRLMALQRERLTQTQVIDQQTRRVLHDDILPTIQTALITLGAEATTNNHVSDAVTTLTDAHRQISDLLRNMPTTSAPDVVRLGLLPALKRAVENDLAHAFDQIIWNIEPTAQETLKQMPSLTAEVLFYASREAVRNAARYGAEQKLGRPFTLTISAVLDEKLIIAIEDNGMGISSNTKSKGSGQGLALHSTMMAVIGGEIIIDSVYQQYTCVKLSLPLDRIPSLAETAPAIGTI
ncbi:MAG: ATP-binding protein [Chloroflexota bacterium]